MALSHKEHLIEQKVLAYESRLKHIDELIDQAENHVDSSEQSDEIADELRMIKSMRDQLADRHEYIDELSSSNWQSETIEHAGPMAIWDTVAQKIEMLIEKFDSHHNKSDQH